MVVITEQVFKANNFPDSWLTTTSTSDTTIANAYRDKSIVKVILVEDLLYAQNETMITKFISESSNEYTLILRYNYVHTQRLLEVASESEKGQKVVINHLVNYKWRDMKNFHDFVCTMMLFYLVVAMGWWGITMSK